MFDLIIASCNEGLVLVWCLLKLQVELSFNTGNVIYVYGEMGDDGFYMGELDGVRGLVPSNFLTEAPPEYGGKGGGRQVGAAVGAPAVGTHRQDRGHGPGARGPPPPPRNEPRADRRKGNHQTDLLYLNIDIYLFFSINFQQNKLNYQGGCKTKQ